MEDVCCKHGVAMDVHCCNCHSGFLFDASRCTCLGEGQVPCVGFVLTAEQAKMVEFKEMKFYEVDGKTLFEVRDSEGKPTGEYTFYVLFE